MRRISAAMFLFTMLILSACNLCAQDHGTGLGVILGEPTGISFKQWLSRTTAIDAGVAWSFANSGAMHIHVDYLIHNFSWIKSADPVGSRLNVYYGIGGRVKFETDSRAGARGVIGLDYFFRNAPLDVFLEIAPILDLAPSTDFSLNGGIGIRYFFGPGKTEQKGR